MSRKQHSNEFFLAEYALGVLEAEQLAQAHALLGSDDSAVACALHWEERFLDLTDTLTPLHASDELLRRIQTSLKLPTQAISPKRADTAPLAANTVASASAATRQAEASARLNAIATPDFEPRLIRPDAASSPTVSPAPEPENPPPAAPKAPTAATPAPASSPSAKFTQARKEPAFSDAKASPQVQPESPRAVAPDPEAEQPTRVRKAPPDPMEAFRPDPTRRRRGRGFWRNLWFWRALTAALVILAGALALPENSFKRDPAQAASLQPAAEPAPQVVQVAIMQAPGTSSTPGWVLTVDSRQNVTLVPHVNILVPETDTVFLWTYNEHSPHPRLLGMVDPSQPLTLPIEVTGEVAPGQIFEMTQESTVGAPREPEGPILFIGRTVSLS